MRLFQARVPQVFRVLVQVPSKQPSLPHPIEGSLRYQHHVRGLHLPDDLRAFRDHGPAVAGARRLGQSSGPKRVGPVGRVTSRVGFKSLEENTM